MWSVRCRSSAGLWRRRREGPQRRLQLAFRVDQEVGGRDDPLPCMEPLEHDVIITHTSTQLDLPRLEIACAVIDEDDLPGACLKHAARGYHLMPSHRNLEGYT